MLSYQQVLGNYLALRRDCITDLSVAHKEEDYSTLDSQFLYEECFQLSPM
jgi:hypothetical protein